MLELSYQFQTLHADYYNSQVRLRKRSNSIIITGKSVHPFETSKFFLHFLQQILVCMLKLSISSDFLNTDSYYNKVQCYKLSISIINPKNVSMSLFTSDTTCVNFLSFQTFAFMDVVILVFKSVMNVQLYSLIQAGYNCPINFKLCMVIPVVVRSELKSVATL